MLSDWSLAPGEIALFMGVVLAAGFLRGFTGFGFAMAAVPLLALALPPAQAVPFVILVQFLAGVWDWREARKHAHWPSLAWLMAGALIGTPLGSLALAVLSADWARLAIAAALMSAVILLARGLRLRAMPPRPALAATGLVAGVFSGVTAMPGPPVIVLYLAGPVAIAVGRASLLMFFLFGNALAAAGAGAAGLVSFGTLVLAAVALPLLLVSQWFGRRHFARASEARYRQVALNFLVVLAVLTAGRAALALLGPA
jgi:uncharacterized membrane protein YfcA